MIEFPIAPYTKYKGVECLMNISTGGCNVTPHVARKSRYSAIDGRTTRHAGYAQSQRRRKLVEERFGWMKDIGGLRKLKHRGMQGCNDEAASGGDLNASRGGPPPDLGLQSAAVVRESGCRLS
jgi:hypothetical protein